MCVVIKTTPTSLSEEDIKAELTASEKPFTKVSRLYNCARETTPVCTIDTLDNEFGKKILSLSTIAHAIIKVEVRRKTVGVIKRKNCQNYGHTFNFCKL